MAVRGVLAIVMMLAVSSCGSDGASAGADDAAAEALRLHAGTIAEEVVREHWYDGEVVEGPRDRQLDPERLAALAGPWAEAEARFGDWQARGEPEASGEASFDTPLFFDEGEMRVRVVFAGDGAVQSVVLLSAAD